MKLHTMGTPPIGYFINSLSRTDWIIISEAILELVPSPLMTSRISVLCIFLILCSNHAKCGNHSVISSSIISKNRLYCLSNKDFMEATLVPLILEGSFLKFLRTSILKSRLCVVLCTILASNLVGATVSSLVL